MKDCDSDSDIGQMRITACDEIGTGGSPLSMSAVFAAVAFSNDITAVFVFSLASVVTDISVIFPQNLYAQLPQPMASITNGNRRG